MKKGQFSFLAKLILVVVTSIVLLMFSSQLFSIIGDFSNDAGCKASAIANSVGNTVSMGADVVKLDCPPKYVLIKDKKSLFERENDFIVKEANVPLTLVEKNRFGVEGELTSNETKMYRVNQIVAEEMRTCWENMGQGKLNLFSSWFEYFADNSNANWLQRMIPERQGAPTVCVICSRIQIDDDVFRSISSLIPNDVTIDNYNDQSNKFSLVYWLTHNPIPRNPISYYEYLLDDSNEDVFGFDNRNFEYTSEPFAVIFSRTNIHALDQLRLKDDVIGSLLIGSASPFLMITRIARMYSIGSTGAQLIRDVAQAKGSVSAVYVVPYESDEFTQYCSQIAN